jgi:uncharacterized membrane protein (Fun14 family)
MEENLSYSLKNSSMIPELPYLNMGASFLVGVAVGFVVKKSFKIMLFLLGIALILIFFLEYKHVITINEDALLSSVDSVKNSFIHFVEFLKDRLNQMKVAGTLSAVTGFIVGIKMG